MGLRLSSPVRGMDPGHKITKNFITNYINRLEALFGAA
jgi:hypothetical protein